MLSPLRKRERLGIVLELVRDAVEIAAITLAGIWAIYVFVYENRVKPTQGPPELTYTATMQRLGEHGGLVGIRLKTETRNVGTVRVHFLGISMTVLGSRIIASSKPRPPDVTDSSNNLQAYYAATRPVAVFRYAFLTHLASPSTGADDWLDPGGVEMKDRIFYVPERRFDRLVAWVVASYTKHDDATVPTSLVIEPNGLPRFIPRTGENEQVRTDLTSLDLAKP